MERLKHIYHITLLILMYFHSGRVSAEQAEPLAPQAAIKLFQIPDDLRIELVAAEPEIFDPVAMAFDAHLNLYVVENRGYPSGNPEGPTGSIAFLQDLDQDGHYEHRTLFADGFDYPNGVMCWRDGIIVTSTPNVYFLKDTDGDHRADEKTILLEGFNPGGSTQLRVSHPTFGIDNRIHFTNGLSGGNVRVIGHPEIPMLAMGRADLAYDPFSHRIFRSAGRAQFGLTFDDYGNKFVCSNRNHFQHVVLQTEDLNRAPFLRFTETVEDIPKHGAASRIYALSEARTTAYAHTGTFTAACGIHLYRGNALPETYLGDGFVCDPTGNLIHRDRLSPSGGTFIAHRADSELASEFLATADNWSRPVFVTGGPDGALYFCDMYRKAIEHPTYLPDEIAAITDFDAGKDRGRIYRITAAISASSVKQISHPFAASRRLLAKSLSSDNGWHRDTARRLLMENPHPEDLALLSAAYNDSPSAPAKAAILHMRYQKNALTKTHLQDAITDLNPNVRVQGIKLIRKAASQHPELIPDPRALANDENATVRFNYALAIGDSSIQTSHEALSEILHRGVDHRWTRMAVLMAVQDEAIHFAELVLESASTLQFGWTDFMNRLGYLLARQETPERTTHFMIQHLNSNRSWSLSFHEGILAGYKRNTSLKSGTSVIDNMKSMTDAGPDKKLLLDTWIHDRIQSSANNNMQDQRLLSIRILGYTDYATAGPPLLALLTPLNAQVIQTEAVRSLNGFRDERVMDSCLDRETWRSFTTPTRREVITGLLVNQTGIEKLVSALENNTVQTWSIDQNSIARLKRTRNPGLKARVLKLFTSDKKSDVAKRYEEYKQVLNLTPDFNSGRKVFESTCQSCHHFGGIGHSVGPDLTGIQSQPLESILLHIINPNSLLLSGYESYLVETKSGDTLIGLITSETDKSITLKQSMGLETTLMRTEIQLLESNSLSLMPESLESGMTHQELRDLLGFLKGK